MMINVYNFEVGNGVISPTGIVQRNNDVRALGKLWTVLNMFGIGRNQLLLDKIEIGV